MIQYSINMVSQYMIQHPPQMSQSQMSEHRRRHFERNREAGHCQLYNDYFSQNPTFPDYMFRRRFRMRRDLFLRLVHAAELHDPFFQQRPDATGRLGMSSLQKCTAAIRVLGYGEAHDRVDEYLRMGETTTRVTVEKFTDFVIAQFGQQYLRTPTREDLERLLHVGAQRGFPGMMGSIDCMHWEWKNCPGGFRGQYQGRSGKATIILEAVASHDLWIWHSFFGIPGSCNDLNVLYRSPIFDDMLNGRAPQVNYTVNGHEYNMGYYLTDGIYPKWSTFIQTIPLPQTPKDKLFAERQEAVRKDVERAFGVLQARFAVIKRPALFWDKRVIKKVITTCIILHNMIVEDERDTYANYTDPNEYNDDGVETTVDNSAFEADYIVPIELYLANRRRLRDTEANSRLRKDLIENIWQKFGDHNN